MVLVVLPWLCLCSSLARCHPTPSRAGGHVGTAERGFCMGQSHVSSQLCPSSQAVFSSPTPAGSSCAAPLGWLQPAPAITCFGINCSVDNPYPTAPCHSPQPSCILSLTLRFPSAVHRGTMRGLFLAPPLPQAATRHTAPVSACSDGAWC